MRCLVRNIMHNCRGFTLIEMLITLAISAVIIVPAGASVVQMGKIYQGNTDNLIVIRNLDAAHDILVSDFQSAQSPLPGGEILTPANGNDLTLVRSVASPSDTTTVYTIVAAGGSSAFGNLQKTVGGTTTVIASNIASVAYYYGNPVEIDVTATCGTVTLTRVFYINSRMVSGS